MQLSRQTKMHSPGDPKPADQEQSYSKFKGNQNRSDHNNRVKPRLATTTNSSSEIRNNLDHHQPHYVVHHGGAAQDDAESRLGQSRGGEDGECGPDAG